MPSVRLKRCIIAAFSLLIYLIFFKTALPLEAKTLLTIWLLNEFRSVLLQITWQGAFFISIAGDCRYQLRQAKLSERFIISSWLSVIEITFLEKNTSNKQASKANHCQKLRLFLMPDSVLIANDFRHLSRVIHAAELPSALLSRYK